MHHRLILPAIELMLILILLVGCGPSSEALAANLAATLTSLPTTPALPTLTPNPTGTPDPTLAPNPTYTAIPTYTLYPTYTPFQVANLFCYYEFCIGMPPGLYLREDESLLKVNKDNGGLFAENDEIAQGVWWRHQYETDWKPEEVLRSMLDPSQVEAGDLQTMELGKLKVYYQLGNSTTQAKRPYFIIATWRCVNRSFRSSIWATQENLVLDLLRQSLSQFACRR